MQVPQSPLLSTLERKSGLISYIGVDGNMYVSDQGGGNLKQLTEDAVIPENQGDPVLYYQYPTWSRDGSQLAFMGISADGEQAKSKLMVANMDDDSVNEVYASESEHPIYLNWSPDNANLSFISTTVSGQNMILQSVPSAGGERTILDTGSPYYWSWAPDGQRHDRPCGRRGSLFPGASCVSQRGPGNDTVTEYGLDVRLPACASRPQPGPRMAAASPWRVPQRKRTRSSSRMPPARTRRRLARSRNKTAFAWSSDGTRFAYIDGEQALDAGTIGPLHIVDMETSEGNCPGGEYRCILLVAQRRGNCLFHPASSAGGGQFIGRIWHRQAAPQYVLNLHVLDVTSGESRELFTYRPTQQFLSILPYFDQYHQSATIWSPDNNNLVLSFLGQSGSPGIAVVAASGKLEPRMLAQGYLAFWSWE